MTNATPSRPSLTLGYERFRKFSAVEGIYLSPRLEGILKTLDERGLQGEERIRLMRELLAEPA